VARESPLPIAVGGITKLLTLMMSCQNASVSLFKTQVTALKAQASSTAFCNDQPELPRTSQSRP